MSRQSLKGANDKIHSEYSHNHPHTAVQISHMHTHNLFQIILEILNGDICPVMCYSVSFPPESLSLTSLTCTLCTNLSLEVK